MNWSYQIGKILYPNFTWTKSPNSKELFITFDDGPHPTITPWVLDVLDDFEAKATFFVVGDNARKFNNTLNLIKEKGHTIGNHTFSHLKGWKTNAPNYLNDIKKCSEVIGECHLFRPPYGRINHNAIPELKDFDIIMWDILSRDYITNLNIKLSLDRMIKRSYNGSIIVFHDSEKAEANMKAMLPEYLKAMQEKGFSFSRL